MSALKLNEVKTNIFHVPQTYALAYAVSGDLNTVKYSLAWQFSIIFGHFDDLNKQSVENGNVAVLEYKSRFIYFLVTKETLHEISSYDSIEAALICMREHMRSHEIRKVAMPRICCGNDRLEWRRVKEIIRQVFQHEYGVEIMICDHRSGMQVPPKCEIIEVKGNLFSAPYDFSLVHSVSADFALCRGIGLQFKCKFGQVQELIKQNKHTGNVAVLKDKERYIYNLVTKERSHEKCTYPALYYALVAMRDHMRQHNVTKLAVPRLGCGIDRLDWMRVKNMFEFVFNNDPVEIVAYFYDPPTMLSRSDLTTVHTPGCRLSKSRSRSKTPK